MSLTTRTLALLVACALSGVWSHAWAQTAPGGGYRVYGVGPRLGENVELALRNAERLGLSEGQIAELNAIREGLQWEVAPIQEQIAGLRAGIRAGEVTYEASAEELRTLLVQLDELAEPYRRGVAETLTAEQHAALQQMMYDTRPYPAWGGRGFNRGGAGWYRGGRGSGFGFGAWRRPGRGAAGFGRRPGPRGWRW